jgi:hypothetical protein
MIEVLLETQFYAEDQRKIINTLHCPNALIYSQRPNVTKLSPIIEKNDRRTYGTFDRVPTQDIPSTIITEDTKSDWLAVDGNPNALELYTHMCGRLLPDPQQINPIDQQSNPIEKVVVWFFVPLGLIQELEFYPDTSSPTFQFASLNDDMWDYAYRNLDKIDKWYNHENKYCLFENALIAFKLYLMKISNANSI